MSQIREIFQNLVVDPELLKKVSSRREPLTRYFIAITPRSGSSYLCDVMASLKLFGRPEEMINAGFIPNILKSIPGRTPEEYLSNVLRSRGGPEGLAGIKASWLQFRDFVSVMQDRSSLKRFKYIYLTRKDVDAQAVSLYKAAESNVFHTNVQHKQDELEKLGALAYDFARIKLCHDSIRLQEDGWQRFFSGNQIEPLRISYEEIESDLPGVIRRIAEFLGLDSSRLKAISQPSIFRKISDDRNLEWSARFALERSAPPNID